MRTSLQLVFGAAFVSVIVFFGVSLNTFLRAPFLMGPRDEADRALITFALQALVCGIALSVMLTLFLKRFRPR